MIKIVRKTSKGILKHVHTSTTDTYFFKITNERLNTENKKIEQNSLTDLWESVTAHLPTLVCRNETGSEPLYVSQKVDIPQSLSKKKLREIV